MAISEGYAGIKMSSGPVAHGYYILSWASNLLGKMQLNLNKIFNNNMIWATSLYFIIFTPVIKYKYQDNAIKSQCFFSSCATPYIHFALFLEREVLKNPIFEGYEVYIPTWIIQLNLHLFSSCATPYIEKKLVYPYYDLAFKNSNYYFFFIFQQRDREIRLWDSSNLSSSIHSISVDSNTGQVLYILYTSNICIL